MSPHTPLLLGLCLPLALGACGLSDEEGGTDLEPTMTMPEPGARATLRADEPHTRDLELAAGTFLRVEVEQFGIDLRLSLFDPQGDELAWADSPTGPSGPEELVAVTPTAGIYRLQVKAPDGANEGEYAVHALEPRPADSRDRRWAEAEAGYWAARQRVKAEQYDEAIPELRRLIPLWQALGHRAREAHTRQELAVALEPQDRGAAVAEWQTAIALYRQLKASPRLGLSLESVGSLLMDLEHLEIARIHLEEAVPLLRRSGHQWVLALALSRLGVIARAQGKPELGLQRQQRALEVALASGREGTEAAVRTDLGLTLLTLRRSAEAEVHFTRAVDVFRQEKEAGSMRLALNGLARAAVQLDNLEAARAVLESALAMDVEDPRSEAVLHHTLGNVFRLEGRWAEAAREFDRALELAETLQISLLRADFLLSQGYLEGAQGRPEVGLPSLEQALEIYQEYGSQPGEASARTRSAELLRTLGRLEEAWERLEPALSAVEHQRGAAGRRDHRLTYFAFRQDYFELGRDLLLELHDRSSDEEFQEEQREEKWLRKAFELDERRRSRELLASVGAEGLRPTSNSQRIVRQNALVEEMRSLVRSATTPDEHGQLPGLLTQWHQLQAQTLTEDVSLPGLEGIRKALDPDTVLLIYSLGEEQSVLWQLSREDLQPHRLPPRASLERKARDFVEALAFPSAENRLAAAVAGPALSRILLGPVAREIQGKRLGIIANGDLQLLPFAALPDPDPVQGSGKAEFLIENHEIGYLPSASVLPALRRRLDELPPHRGLAIFADPVFTAQDPRVAASLAASARQPTQPAGGGADAEDGDLSPPPSLGRSVRDLGLGGLRRLPGARQEAERLQYLAREALGEHSVPEMVTDFAASREGFLAVAGEPLAVLHIATHALLHPEPELSGLVFSQVGPDGRAEDGFLTGLDIAQQRFPVDLVSLSACQTGIGKALAGEGTLGLSWAFLDAGAGRVLASLWEVSDEQTALLMEEFYRALFESGLPPTAALRQAQRALIRRPGSTPYDWAGFLIQGDGFRELEFTNN